MEQGNILKLWDSEAVKNRDIREVRQRDNERSYSIT
jgi:hypothetical protein